jgi:uncharacterized OB-fold protein
MSSYNKPLPKIDDHTRPYWEFARLHQLSVQRCSSCGHRHFPPSPVCPACLSDDQGWEIVSGRGELRTWCEFHRAYWPAFGAELPYNVCVVQLAEGPRVVSNLLDPPPKMWRGMPVQAVFEDVTTEVSLVRFRAI